MGIPNRTSMAMAHLPFREWHYRSGVRANNLRPTGIVLVCVCACVCSFSAC